MITKKNIYGVLGLAILFGVIITLGGMKKASAQVNINLGLGSALPQEVVIAPGGVYFVPNQNVDVFYNGGYWWATRENQWYRSNAYNGNWKVVEPRYVPVPVYNVYKVPNYREVYGNQEGNRIPYGQWKKQGKQVPYGQWKKHENQTPYGHIKNQEKQAKQKGHDGKENGGKGKKQGRSK